MDAMALTKLSYGLYIITTWTQEGTPTGCTANAAMQVTASPETVAVSINHHNFTNTCIKKNGRFAISVLGEHTQPAVIGAFGFRSGHDCQKFDAMEPDIKGFMPIVPGTVAYVCCEVINTMETDTHTVFLGKVTDAGITSQDTPMTYAYYHDVIKGKSPKNAPTYIKEQPSK